MAKAKVASKKTQPAAITTKTTPTSPTFISKTSKASSPLSSKQPLSPKITPEKAKEEQQKKSTASGLKTIITKSVLTATQPLLKHPIAQKNVFDGVKGKSKVSGSGAKSPLTSPALKPSKQPLSPETSSGSFQGEFSTPSSVTKSASTPKIITRANCIAQKNKSIAGEALSASDQETLRIHQEVNDSIASEYPEETSLYTSPKAPTSPVPKPSVPTPPDAPKLLSKLEPSAPLARESIVIRADSPIIPKILPPKELSKKGVAWLMDALLMEDETIEIDEETQRVMEARDKEVQNSECAYIFDASAPVQERNAKILAEMLKAEHVDFLALLEVIQPGQINYNYLDEDGNSFIHLTLLSELGAPGPKDDFPRPEIAPIAGDGSLAPPQDIPENPDLVLDEKLRIIQLLRLNGTRIYWKNKQGQTAEELSEALGFKKYQRLFEHEHTAVERMFSYVKDRPEYAGIEFAAIKQGLRNPEDDDRDPEIDEMQEAEITEQVPPTDEVAVTLVGSESPQ